MPARNAPSAIDRPSTCVSQAVNSTITRARVTNSSGERAAATSWNSRGSTQRLASSKPINSSTALPRVRPSSTYQTPLLSEVRAGNRVSSNTATRSWNSKTPMAFWPWLLKISPRLLSSRLTMAVDDSARPAPSTRATASGTSSTIRIPPSNAVLASTCKPPRVNTTCRSASMRGRENSRPRVNSRNTTPSSARCGRSAELFTQLKAFGPISRPTHK